LKLEDELQSHNLSHPSTRFESEDPKVQRYILESMAAKGSVHSHSKTRKEREIKKSVDKGQGRYKGK
jgi:hypothetical protein